MPVNKQLSFGAGEVNPSLYGRADLQKFDSACRTLKNMVVHVEGGASNRVGLEYIGAVHDSSEITRLVEFRFNAEQTYVLEFSDLAFRVIKDQAYVMNSAVTITAISKADPVELTIGAHSLVVGQEVRVVGGDMVELKTGFYRIKTKTATKITLEDIFGTAIDSTAFTTYTTGGTTEAIPIFTTVFTQASLALLKFTQNADTLTVTHPSFDMYDITRSAHDVWTVDILAFASAVAKPTGFSATPSGSAGVIRDYVITAVDDDTGEESIASDSDDADNNLAADVTRTNDLAWTDPTGVSWNVYCDDNASGVFGFIGTATTNVFEDNFITPDYNKTPPENKTPFTGSNNKPRCLAYHQQRRMYASTINKPSTFFASRIGFFVNMNVSDITQADDAITFNVVADDVNEIRDMLSLKDLFLFTSSGIFRIVTGESLAFTVDNISSEEQESWEVSDVRAIKVGQSFLYVQDGGRVVRDLQDTIESNGFAGDDLTLLAKHLFKERTIVEWAYARDPDSIVWCVMDDGTVNALTYLRKHQIWAWTHHVTDGLFKSVAAIAENTSEYGVYFVVEREIVGTTGSTSTMKYVERLKNRDLLDIKDSFFVDSGLSLDVPVTISGATAALPVVITATSHGFTDADFIDHSDIEGMTELNGNRYKIGNKTTHTYELFSRSQTIETITAASKAVACEITIGTHTHTEGQQVTISGVVGMTDLNGNTYQVKSATATKVKLKSIAGVDLDSTGFATYVSGGVAEMDDNIDGNNFTPYVSGGKARLAVTTVSGLEHLEGEDVSVLADGSTEHNPNDSAVIINTVSGGSITLEKAASRIHVGLPYTSDLENIGVDLSSLNGFGDSLARIKSIPVVKMRLQDTAGIQIGPNEADLKEYKHPGFDANQGPTFINEVIEQNLFPKYDHDGTTFIRQDKPLPMTILNLMPEVRVNENP